MPNRFEDRLRFSTYSEEEPVGFALAPPEVEPDLDAMIYVPKTLVYRLVAVAAAYELNHLPMIDVHGDTRLNWKQRQGIVDELDFIGSLLRDPAAIEAVARIRALAEDRRELDLIVSAP